VKLKNTYVLINSEELAATKDWEEAPSANLNRNWGDGVACGE
jgi:hypothetical protein